MFSEMNFMASGRAWSTVLLMLAPVWWQSTALHAQQPQAAPAQAGDASAAPRSPALEAVLDRMDLAGRDLRDLQAKVQFSRVQLIKDNPDDPDEVINYVGHVALLRGSPAYSMVHFEKMNDGRTWDKRETWYVFDGRWLVTADERGRSIIKRELVRSGQSVDPFKLGEGPLPLPFGQDKAEIVRQFHLTLMPESKDVPDSDHLLCHPRPGSELADSFARIELFISRRPGASYGLPIKIVAENVQEATLDTAVFEDIRKNDGLTADSFSLPSKTKGWTLQEEPLPQ